MANVSDSVTIFWNVWFLNFGCWAQFSDFLRCIALYV